MIRSFGILVVCGSLLGLFSPLITPLFLPHQLTLAWLCDLASHWQWLYMLLLVLGLLLLAPKNKAWLVSGLALALPFLTASPILKTATSSNHSLKVLSSNVHFSNPDLTQLKALATQQNPDVIVICEYTPQHTAFVKAWKDYPYQLLNPADHPFGMAILSRTPLSQPETLQDSLGIQYLSVQREYQQQAIKLIGFHPQPPMTKEQHPVRDQILRQFTSSHHQPTLIVGDFNATPWSTAFTGLAERGFYRTLNLLPTWPTKFQGFMGIPIDQLVASSQWKVVSAKVYPSIGSDHYPVIVEVSL